MREKRFLLNVFMLVVVAFLPLLIANQAVANFWIDSFEVIPPNPTDLDPIIIGASGSMPDTSYQFWGSDSDIINNSVFVDFDLRSIGEIFIPVLVPWSAQEPIGTLSAGTYSLTVRAYDLYGAGLVDTHTTSFVVTPEPATLLLLSLGGLFFRRHRA